MTTNKTGSALLLIILGTTVLFLYVVAAINNSLSLRDFAYNRSYRLSQTQLVKIAHEYGVIFCNHYEQQPESDPVELCLQFEDYPELEAKITGIPFGRNHTTQVALFYRGNEIETTEITG